MPLILFCPGKLTRASRTLQVCDRGGDMTGKLINGDSYLKCPSNVFLYCLMICTFIETYKVMICEKESFVCSESSMATSTRATLCRIESREPTNPVCCFSYPGVSFIFPFHYSLVILIFGFLLDSKRVYSFIS